MVLLDRRGSHGDLPMPNAPTLRSKLIRLAHARPDLRADLLAVLAPDAKVGARRVGPAIQKYSPRDLAAVCTAFTGFLIGDPDGYLNRMKSIGNPGVYPIPGAALNDLWGRLPTALVNTIAREFQK